MTITILIIAYVANVFLNRWLNKMYVRYTTGILGVIPAIWFLSLIGTLWLIIWIILDFMEDIKIKFPKNWFTGKNW